jgi:MoxR-like ATPase
VTQPPLTEPAAVGRELLDELDGRRYFGSGPRPSAVTADDRSGRYWLVTDERVRLAVQVALLTGRPLLVQGPSGSGKSSLARALANTLGWTYYETVVTSQTRLEELVGYVDVVRRLHEAELSSRRGDVDFPRDLGAFVVPGILWWAFDPHSAVLCGTRAGADADAAVDGPRDPGVLPNPPVDEPASAVVLLDEIDKAEPDLPNNLLVPLGSQELRVEGRAGVVTVTRRHRPLIVITSNRERDLPPAFLRRCVLLEIGLPAPAQLVAIAVGHVNVDREFVERVRDRLFVTDDSVSPAEFVDAVRAARGFAGRPDEEERWRQVREILGWPAKGATP